jgi:hypothetical protein
LNEKEREGGREKDRMNERSCILREHERRREKSARASERVYRHVSVCVWRFLCACVRVQRRNTRREREREKKRQED